MLFFLLLVIVPGVGVAQSYECEDTCNHIHGIDVSRYQGKVFWETVGNETKMAYAYIKATEGSGHIDPKYEENVLVAHQCGLKVGSYHFYRALVPQEEQLLNFITQCRPSEQDLIPMIDVEVMPNMPTEDFCDSLLLFLEMVEEYYHQRPLIYTGTNFYNKYLAGRLDRYLLMIAQYSDAEPALVDERDVTMWQYTGKGRLNGVAGYVDKSRFMGDHKLREIRFRHRRHEE